MYHCLTKWKKMVRASYTGWCVVDMVDHLWATITIIPASIMFPTWACL